MYARDGSWWSMTTSHRRRCLAMILKLDGHDVQVAHEGTVALDIVRRFRPEAVLMDIGLPGMDGYEVAQRAATAARIAIKHHAPGSHNRLCRGQGPATLSRGRL